MIQTGGPNPASESSFRTKYKASNEIPFIQPKGKTMKNNPLHTLKNKTANAMRHVHRNRAKYATLVTSVVFVKLMIAQANGWNQFLEEHGLTEEFYHFEEDEA